LDHPCDCRKQHSFAAIRLTNRMQYVLRHGVLPGAPGYLLRAVPYADEAMVAKMGERMRADRAFLFGRRTYGQLLASWNARGGPSKDALNSARKSAAWSTPVTKDCLKPGKQDGFAGSMAGVCHCGADP